MIDQKAPESGSAHVTRTRRMAVLFGLSGFLAVLPALAQQAPQATGGTQWMNFNNQLDGQRYSPLTQITPQNAARLREVCRLTIDGPTAFSAGLLVFDGVIYTNTARQTVAVDARTCQLRWRHTHVPEDDELRQSSRGPAVLNGRVFRGTGDGRLIALDAATGKLLWSNAIGVPRLSEFASAAPLAWQGMVFMGIGGGDAGVRGRVMAYDAVTGRELWRFHTIPMGSEQGAETWQRPESAKTGGGGIWGAMTLDAATGELFVPVGNPWPDIDAAYRPGANLFTNSLVVLDAQTGALKWWYQAVPADTHDFDLAAAPVLYRNPQIRDIAAFVGKDGYLTALDRDTRKPLFRTPLMPMLNEGVPATPEGTRICPGFAGGTAWNGPALDRMNNTLLVGTRQGGCMTLRPAPTVYAPPRVDYGGTVTPDPTDIPTGTVTAVDAGTGAIRWAHRTDEPVVAAITPTAGGVTFAGDQGGRFMVLDSRTGSLLHAIDTRGAMVGGLVTYEIAGTQYVAMASGNVSRVATRVTGLPSIVIMALEGQARSPPIAAARGRGLYAQICAACHGADGNLVADKKLSTLHERHDLASTIAYLRNPKPPMPKLFPDILSEQDLRDIGEYLFSNLQEK
jgi:alcohol dehydrogenase (cytochrome c)